MKEDKNISTNYKKLIEEAIEELKTPGKRHKQIPNILTALRLFAPILIIPAAITGNIPLTIAMAAGFGLTDLADGYIARHWKLTSELGKDLDALADKMFSGTLLLAASFINPLLLLNVGLEMAIAGVNIHQKAKGKETSSTMTGKVKTWALFILAGLGIAVPSATEIGLTNGLSVLTAGLQALTIGSYIKQYNETQDENNKPTPPAPKNPTQYQSSKTDQEKINQCIKTYTEGQESPEKSPEDFLEELKELSSFLHEEQKNQAAAIFQEAVNEQAIQKVKSQKEDY